MKRWTLYGAAGALAILLGLAGCSSGLDVPRAGDTITPRLDRPINWAAGKPANLYVRLEAQGEGPARKLDFAGLSAAVDPMATITFLEGESPIGTSEVKLSHRC